LRHAANAGQSASLWTGFNACRGEVIATLDGDLQNDPADLPRMLELLADCDMVTGVRTRRADDYKKRVSTKVARWARRLALRVDFADTGCNLRVFRRGVLQTIPPFNGFHRFMPVLAHVGGAVVKEAPVTHHHRHSGKSNYGLRNRAWRGLVDLVMVRLYSRRQLRIYQR
jgi:dolichol-phosphate mannosyltransferase